MLSLAFFHWSAITMSGEEASWDVPVRLAKDLQEGVDFRPGSRRIVIMFTDEQGQTYFEPEDLELSSPNNEEQMCEAIQEADITLYVLTELDAVYTVWNEGEREEFLVREDFDECATIFALSEEPQDMVSRLQDVANMVCEE